MKDFSPPLLPLWSVGTRSITPFIKKAWHRLFVPVKCETWNVSCWTLSLFSDWRNFSSFFFPFLCPSMDAFSHRDHIHIPYIYVRALSSDLSRTFTSPHKWTVTIKAKIQRKCFHRGGNYDAGSTVRGGADEGYAGGVAEEWLILVHCHY